MPHAIKLRAKYADQGLHVLLVESQGHKRDEVVPFMSQYWSGIVPMGVLGTNSPFSLPGNTLPKAGLVGVDGTLVWSGDGSNGCEKILEEQLSKMHQVVPLEGPLKPLAKDLNARNLGKAAVAARVIVEKGANDKAKTDAGTLVAHLTKTVDNRVGMAKRLLAAGRPLKAKLALQKLAKEVKDDKAWAERIAAEIKEIDGGSKDDLAADKKVMEAEEMAAERKGRDGAITKLAEVIKKNSSSKIVTYAEELKKALESKSAAR
ncbi:MAG: hypothetical protein ACKVS6_09685 [Planctomycetota bacterium]